MKIIQQSFGIGTKRRGEMIDITAQVQSVVSQSGIKEGEVTVYCPHTTAAVTINENADPSVIHDILLTLEELVPLRRAVGRAGLHARRHPLRARQPRDRRGHPVHARPHLQAPRGARPRGGGGHAEHRRLGERHDHLLRRNGKKIGCARQQLLVRDFDDIDPFALQP